jgi:undecaprenyl-phosphate galactose phosphotransferase/putative colanic acid biosynthesis UDP-glucose lipid carrier transferase
MMIILGSVISGVGYHLQVFGHVGDVESFIGIGCNAAFIFVLLARSQGMYRPAAIHSKPRQLRSLFMAWCVVLFATVALLFLLKVAHSYSRGSIVAFGVLGLFLLTAWHVVVRKLVRGAIADGSIAGQPAIVIGERQELDHYASLNLLQAYGVREIARVELPDDLDARNLGVESVLRNAVDVAQRGRAELVLLVLKWTDWGRYEAIREHLRVLPLPVFLLPDSPVRSILTQPLAEMGSEIAIEVQRPPLSISERATKRLLDVSAAAVGLIVLAPLLAAVSIAVKLTSPGTVLFKQRRKGFNGQEFTIYKFRTMTVAEDGPTVRQARPGDERITRLGAILRRTSIDELPQLLNVLRGQMSLVGPRPHALAHDNEYSQRIAKYAFRHHVKPGITGWAQVNGLRGATSKLEFMERRVEFDLWYIDNWSLWLDLRILLKTCLEVPRGDNAY